MRFFLNSENKLIPVSTGEIQYACGENKQSGIRSSGLERVNYFCFECNSFEIKRIITVSRQDSGLYRVRYVQVALYIA